MPSTENLLPHKISVPYTKRC